MSNIHSKSDRRQKHKVLILAPALLLILTLPACAPCSSLSDISKIFSKTKKDTSETSQDNTTRKSETAR